MIERPQTKPKIKRLILELTFVIMVLLWLGFLSFAMVMVDDGFKQRLNKLEQEVQDLKAASENKMPVAE